MRLNRVLVAKLFVVILFVLGISVRLYHFPDRAVLTLEQGITLTTTHDYLYGKFSLLGLPNVQRFTSTGLRIYSGPLYNYALMPVMKVLGPNPITLTYFAFAINILTALLMYLLIKKLSGGRVAFFSTLFFLFSVTMIGQSTMLWILNPLPLVGLLGMYLLIKHKNGMTPWTVLLLGILGGVAISLEWMCVFTVGVVFLYLVFKSSNRTRDILMFMIGAGLPLLPTAIFDFRHGWYHLQTLWQYTLDTISNPGQGKPTPYHFYHFLPLWFYILGIVTSKLSKLESRVGYLFAAVYLIYGASISLSAKPVVNVPTLLEVSSQISALAGPEYNVVYMPDSEYRAYALRYILTAIHNKPPMAVDAYPSAKELYVVATPDRSLDTDVPWEISSFHPTKRNTIYTSLNQSVVLYKLEQ